MRDRIGLAFFTFAAMVSFLAAWEHPIFLAWLTGVHNALLAAIYIRRKPPVKYDRPGLLLGLLAAVLPMMIISSVDMSLPLVITGILGYSLVFWSLISLGNRFGIAPADRGLVVCGPYRIVRHPMYLGELVLRAALVAASTQVLPTAGLLISLAVIQILRALREEHIITGYDAYASLVPYRLVPGVW
jgi:protein-S-isoprenylcysteine O-methyltransferase Ste14